MPLGNREGGRRYEAESEELPVFILAPARDMGMERQVCFIGMCLFTRMGKKAFFIFRLIRVLLRMSTMKYWIICGALGICLLLGSYNTFITLDGAKPTAPITSNTNTVELASYNSQQELQRKYYKKNPQRVVAVWQNSIETLIDLGVGDRIVAGIGVPNESYIKAENRAIYAQIPHKSISNLDVESVLLMQPELIVAWHSSFGDKFLRSTEFWQSRGVNTYISNLPSPPMATTSMLEKEYNYILDMGKIFDREQRAAILVDNMRQELEFAGQHGQSVAQKPQVLIMELYGRQLMTSDKKSLAGELVGKLGAELVADSNRMSIEQIVSINPQAIFLVIIESQYGSEQLLLDKIYKNPALKNLQCVQQQRVYTIPLYTIYCAGTRLHDGIRILAKGIYPDLYKE